MPYLEYILWRSQSCRTGGRGVLKYPEQLCAIFRIHPLEEPVLQNRGEGGTEYPEQLCAIFRIHPLEKPVLQNRGEGGTEVPRATLCHI